MGAYAPNPLIDGLDSKKKWLTRFIKGKLLRRVIGTKEEIGLYRLFLIYGGLLGGGLWDHYHFRRFYWLEGLEGTLKLLKVFNGHF